MDAMRLGLLRPHDTLARGWTTLARCDRCRSLWAFHPPADARKCDWSYVATLARCPRCGAQARELLFRGPRDPATGRSADVGAVTPGRGRKERAAPAEPPPSSPELQPRVQLADQPLLVGR